MVPRPQKSIVSICSSSLFVLVIGKIWYYSYLSCLLDNIFRAFSRLHRLFLGILVFMTSLPIISRVPAICREIINRILICYYKSEKPFGTSALFCKKKWVYVYNDCVGNGCCKNLGTPRGPGMVRCGKASTSRHGL